jgi:predicted enzyme related to lactoylglutathione lyase
MKDFDNFFLPANDLSIGKEFYHDILGLDVKFDFSKQGMMAFKVGQQEPAIILKAHPDAKPTIWFTVEDVGQEHDRLRARGVKFISEPFRIRTGLAAEFEDPFGNRLGITDYSASSSTRAER